MAGFRRLQHTLQQHVLSNSPINTLEAALTEEASSTIANALAELLSHARAPLLATARAQQLLLPAASPGEERAPTPPAQAAAGGACQPGKARQQQQQQAERAAGSFASSEARTTLLLQAVAPAQCVVVLGELVQALLFPQDVEDRCAGMNSAAASAVIWDPAGCTCCDVHADTVYCGFCAVCLPV
jgi:hypothetical protein